MIGTAFGLKGGGPVLEELLLPAVEHRRLQSQLVTELGDRLLLQQMPPEDGNLLFCDELNRCAVMADAASPQRAPPSVERGSLKHWIRLFPQMTNLVSQGAFA